MPKFDPLWTLYKRLEEVGVEPKLPFLNALVGTEIIPYTGPSAYPEGAAGVTPERLERYPALKPGGGDLPAEGTIEVSPGEPEIFLHEALHRLDDMLPSDVWWKVVSTGIQHYGKTDPEKAYGWSQALYGKNPELPAHEVFPRIVSDFLLNREGWPKEMGGFLSDYFGFK